MILQIFSVFDNKTMAFNEPFFVHNRELAMRAYQVAALDSATFVGKNPGDYGLYHLGSFDDETAKFSMLPQPEILISKLVKPSEE